MKPLFINQYILLINQYVYLIKQIVFERNREKYMER